MGGNESDRFDLHVLNFRDYADLTDAEIAKEVRDAQNIHDFSLSMQVEGRAALTLLQMTTAIAPVARLFEVPKTVATLLGAAPFLAARGSQNASDLREGVNSSRGVPEIAEQSVIAGNSVLLSRPLFGFGVGERVNRETSAAINFDGDPDNDVQNQTVLWDGSIVQATPTVADRDQLLAAYDEALVSGTAAEIIQAAMDIPGLYHDAILLEAARLADSGDEGGDGSSGWPTSSTSSPSNGNNPDGGFDHSGSGTTTGSGWTPSGGQWEGGNGNQNHGTPDPSLPEDPNYKGVQPIILDLNGNGIDVSFGNTTSFDYDNDGYRERTSWAAADDGLLVVDLDADGSIGTTGGDGVIEQGMEIAFAQWMEGGATDLQALAQATDADGKLIFDSNADGVLNAEDDIWAFITQHKVNIGKLAAANRKVSAANVNPCSTWTAKFLKSNIAMCSIPTSVQNVGRKSCLR